MLGAVDIDHHKLAVNVPGAVPSAEPFTVKYTGDLCTSYHIEVDIHKLCGTQLPKEANHVDGDVRHYDETEQFQNGERQM